jgi:predicted amidohydrolase YtcJ
VRPPAETIGPTSLAIVEARLWTGNAKQPEAQALFVSGSKIAAVGTTEAVLELAGPRTRIIEAQGRRVVPGFNDAHVHFYMGGDALTSVDLRGARSAGELRDRLGAFARSRPRGEWILNGSWDHEAWTPPELPTHELIDEVTAEHPVWVSRSDLHMALANALALRLAGVDRDTPDVPGGEIVRDRDGHPTGILKDAAKSLVDRVIPLPPHGRILEAVRSAQDLAAANGVTSVQDMGVLGSRGGEVMIEVLRAYQALQRRGELKVRISAHLPLPEWRRLADAGVMAGFGTDKLRIGAVKSFTDGSLGSSSAWFYEPYSDAPGEYGAPSDELVDPERHYRQMRDADAAGLQIALHAIGDRANGVALDLWQRLAADNGPRDRRGRIEHAQHVRPPDLARFAAAGVIASMQPYHCLDDGRWAERRIGPERAKYAYAFRKLIDAGAVVAFGSDWAVAPLNPLLTIYAAVTRRTLDGRHPDGWMPEEKLSVAEALHACTYQGAYASGEEQLKGSLDPGKLADVVMLSEDIFSIDPVAIRDTRVDTTILDGQVVFERA